MLSESSSSYISSSDYSAPFPMVEMEEKVEEEQDDFKVEVALPSPKLLDELHGIEDFDKIVAANADKILGALDMSSLLQHLPKGSEDPKGLIASILRNETNHKNILRQTPLEHFSALLKHQKLRQESKELDHATSILRLLDRQRRLQLELDNVEALERAMNTEAREVIDQEVFRI